ncbi:MAG: galactokinase [Chloroflexi bacterium]|nr:galactokinase [Chloroflexota bacterium]
MIVTRTPLRVPLGGGGTDIQSYYSKYGGLLISAAINKYVYITLNKPFINEFIIKYSKTENVNNVDEIEHSRIREAIRLLAIEPGLEIVSIADIPANTGLGNSSSFMVGLLNALHALNRNHISAYTLAEEACKIEIDILREPIGKQDQYIAAIGGVTCLDIDKQGQVSATPLRISDDIIAQLESNILLFYTGIKRSASEVLTEQNKATERDEKQVVTALHTIKEIGKEINAALVGGDLRHFGELMDAHWEIKKTLSDKITFSQIDKWYNIAKNNGALGGKIMGAGGGGFFMFYCEDGKNNLRETLTAEGLQELRFRFDFEGSKVAVNF